MPFMFHTAVSSAFLPNFSFGMWSRVCAYALLDSLCGFLASSRVKPARRPCSFPFARFRFLVGNAYCQVLIPCACTGQGVGHHAAALVYALAGPYSKSSHPQLVTHRIPSEGSGVPTCPLPCPLPYITLFCFFVQCPGHSPSAHLLAWNHLLASAHLHSDCMRTALFVFI